MPSMTNDYRTALGTLGMHRLSEPQPALAVLDRHGIDVGPLGRFLLEGWQVVDYFDQTPEAKALGIAVYAVRTIVVRSMLSEVPGAYREALAHEAAHAIAHEGGFDAGANGHNRLWSDTARTNGATYGAEPIGPPWLTFTVAHLEQLEAYYGGLPLIDPETDGGGMPNPDCATEAQPEAPQPSEESDEEGEEPEPAAEGEKPSDDPGESDTEGEGEGEPGEPQPSDDPRPSDEDAAEGDPSEGEGDGSGMADTEPDPEGEGDPEPEKPAIRGGALPDGGEGPRVAAERRDKAPGVLGSLRTRYSDR